MAIFLIPFGLGEEDMKLSCCWAGFLGEGACRAGAMLLGMYDILLRPLLVF